MMPLDFTDVFANWEPFLTGAWMTLFVSMVSIGLGVLGGLTLCFMVMSRSAPLRKFGRV